MQCTVQKWHEDQFFYIACLHYKSQILLKSADLGLALFTPHLNTSTVMKHSACSSVTSTEKKEHRCLNYAS